MELSELIKFFVPEGVWAILSFILISYIIKAQEKRDIRQDEREKNYQNIIINLSNALQELNEIKEIIKDSLCLK